MLLPSLQRPLLPRQLPPPLAMLLLLLLLPPAAAARCHRCMAGCAG
jgi:hypothetical protein